MEKWTQNEIYIQNKHLRGLDGRGLFRFYQSPLKEELCITI